MVSEQEQPESVREMTNVRVATEEAGVQVYRGRLRESASAVFEKLKRAFTPETVPLLQAIETKPAVERKNGVLPLATNQSRVNEDAPVARLASRPSRLSSRPSLGAQHFNRPHSALNRQTPRVLAEELLGESPKARSLRQPIRSRGLNVSLDPGLNSKP